MSAPGFQLPNQHGEPVSLEGLRGSAVVLVFYPFAFSRVCTDELDVLQSELGEFERHGARLLAISTDSKYALRAYSDERGYTFDLLADFWPHGAVADRYGVLDASLGHAGRATFFLDQEGTLRSRIDAPPGQARSFDDYRAALGELAEAPVSRQ
nr:peroxiredoxin [Arthrobacter sp. JZ12]